MCNVAGAIPKLQYAVIYDALMMCSCTHVIIILLMCRSVSQRLVYEKHEEDNTLYK